MAVHIFKSLNLLILIFSIMPLIAQKKEIKKSDQKEAKPTEKKC